MGRRDLPVSVPAETSEFFKAEVHAFMCRLKIEQPAAWLLVQRLQQSCREAPKPAQGVAARPEPRR